VPLKCARVNPLDTRLGPSCGLHDTAERVAQKVRQVLLVTGVAVVKPGENTEREAAGIGHECGKFPSFCQPRNGLPKLREVIDYRPAHIVMCIKVSVRVV